jgi:protein-S-isoprenylcysteine O-methyltransferase Ste14
MAAAEPRSLRPPNRISEVSMGSPRFASADIDSPYSAEQRSASGPGTPFPPTLFYVIGLGLGWWFEEIAPLGALLAQSRGLAAVGWALTGAGAVLFLWGLATFARRRTGIMLQRAATCVVADGPYRWSRNPQYVAFTLTYVGIALAAGLFWAFLFLPLVLAVLQSIVIAREERYMRDVFGPAYEEYCRQVRRWL